jgi:hypothetical protein
MSISSNDLSGTINSGFNFGGNTFQIGFIIHTSNNLINQDNYNSNNLFNYSSNNSNNLSDFIKNTSYNLTTTTANNSNSSNFLFNYSLTNSNNLANYILNNSNISLTNSNNLANISLTNSNNLANISLTNSNNLANYILNNSNYFSNLSLTNSNDLNNLSLTTSNNLANISLTNSNNLANYILNNSNISLTNSNNLANYILNNSNYFSNLSLTNSNNLAKYTSNNSNLFNNQLANINTDTIIQGSSNRFIVNDIYNRNITFTNTLFSSNITTSNLNVIGDTTVLNTTIYQTEQLQVVNDTTATALIVKQINSNKNVSEFYYQNNQLGFIINSNGNIGIGITNPLNKLDVNGNINTTNLLLSGVNINTTITNISNNLINQDTYHSNNLINQDTYHSNKLINHVSYTSNILATSSANSLNSGGTITGQLTLSTSVNNPLYITSTSTTVNNSINIKNNSTYNAYIGVGATAFGGNYANNFFIESSSSSIIFNTNGRTSTSTPNMIINSAGNVGIGTITPTCPLSFNTTGYKIISIYDNGLTNNFQFVGLGANNGLCFNTFGISDAFQFRVGTSTTAANELMRINGNGSVCIGTVSSTSSNTKLTISGVSSGYSQPLVNITQTGAWDGNYALQVTGYTNLGGFRINGADTGNSIYQSTLNTNMGFGLNPANSSGNITFITYGTSGNIIFYTQGANERMKIDPYGIITTSSNIDCGGGIAINGSTGFFATTPIDAGNLTNTYINFKYAGTSDDWCYLRQIGGYNAFKLAFDFHDDIGDARFCIRSIESTGNPDNITEVFTVDNGTVTCTGNLGVGITNPPVKFYVNGDIAATGNITAYYSDIRLKNIHSNIINPLNIINNLSGFYYTPNELGKSLGIKNNKMEIGLSAQDVQKVLPEIINIAPFDMELDDNGIIKSKSGDNYLTISYERIVPVLIEGIKEQNKKIINLENEINKIKSLLNL